MTETELTSCRLCPRECGADRTRTTGFCGGGGKVRVARAMLHQWEEPCLSGTNGAGAVFFSGCPLRCCYCQNRVLSKENFGAEISSGRLGEIFLELQEQGAHNLDLVSPTQYVPWILEALEQVKSRLHIPVVYNTGGYEKVETLRRLEGLVDIYLPDLKYFAPERGRLYSGAEDYFEKASEAILEMFRQTGKPVFDEAGLMKRGVIVRHLVLPGGRLDSEKVLDWLGANFRPGEILLSLMSQYTPDFYEGERKELKRPLSTYEYRKVLECAEKWDFDGFSQERDSANPHYTPDFSLQGVLEKENFKKSGKNG